MNDTNNIITHGFVQFILMIQFFQMIVSTCDLSFLRHLDFKLLDETQYCQLIVNIPDFDVSTLNGLNIYAGNQTIYCSPALELRELQSLDDEQICMEPAKDLLIKDPEVTFLFWYSKEESLDELLTDAFYKKVSCNLPKQPYFFVVTQDSVNSFVIEEIQTYTKQREKVLVIEKQQEHWKIKKSSVTSTFKRRNNFHEYKIKAYYANYFPWGIVDQSGRFAGYDGDIGTYMSEQLNFTLELIPIDVWGTRTKNGSYTGAIKDLKDNSVDIGIASFSLLPERLEVTDAGFTNLKFTPELIYWKYQNSSFIYGLVFTLEFWMVLLIMIFTSAILLFLKFRIYEKSEDCRMQFLICITTNLRSLAVLEIGRFEVKYLSLRIHLYTMAISGAFLYATYTGVLVSYFSSESTAPPITSLESLAKVPNLNIMFLNEASAHQHIMRALKNKPQLETIIQSKMKLFPSIPEMEAEFLKTRFDSNQLIMLEVKMFLNLMNGKFSLI